LSLYLFHSHYTILSITLDYLYK